MVLTDINSTAGVAEWMRLAPRYGIRALAGLDCRSGCQRRYVLIARNHAGYPSQNEKPASVSTRGHGDRTPN
ncbi:MAG: hypothetical protein ACKOBI_02980, partial [Bacteroidota bacterium]